MHNLFSKKNLWGLVGLLVAFSMLTYPGLTHLVAAHGGYSANPSVAAAVEQPSVLSAVDTFIGSSSTWAYFAHSYAAPTGWTSLSFDSSTWPSGPAILGYGNGTETTVIPYGSNSSAKWLTSYFRKTFSVASPSKYSSFSLKLLVDDGAIVYLNGKEVLRQNIPTGTVGYSTRASSCVEDTSVSVTLPTSMVVAGNNIVTAELHQCDPTTADATFQVRLYGALPITTATAGAPAPTIQPTGIAPIATAQPTAQPTALPTTPAVSPTPISGDPLPAAPSGQKWVFAWGDEFNGTAVDTTKWAVQNRTRSEDPNRTYYIPRNVAVGNGYLTLTIKKEAYSGVNYTGGMLESTGNYRSNLYGYYEARIKNNLVGPGFWTNFWMTGVNQWPPEFDNEIVAHKQGYIYEASHYKNSSGVDSSSHLFVPVKYTDWHVYGIRWLPNEPIRFYIDGNLVFTSTAPVLNPPTVNMYLALRAGAYYSSSWGGLPDSTTVWPGTVQYDWVRIYKAQ